MKKKILFVPFVLIIVISIDLSYRAICSMVFNKIPKGSSLYTEQLFYLNDNQSDILIVGASKATHNYIPSIIADSLNCTCYNAGSDGKSIVNQYLNIIKASDNYPIKTVILDVSHLQFSTWWIEDRNTNYRLFYWKNDSIKSVLDELEGKVYNRILLSSGFVQYNCRLYSALSCIRDSHVDSLCGFQPLPYSGEVVETDNPIVYTDNNDRTRDISAIAINYFDRLINLCKRKNIELITIYSPSLEYAKDFSTFIKGHCEEKNIKYYDYGQWENVTGDTRLFKDPAHLNERGALIFTNEIISLLKNNK